MIDINIPKSTPLLSVVIPTFNCGAYISDALDSVFSQTFKDYNIIVIDDGSTDNTREIVDNIPGRISYWRRLNEGPSAARNYGIKLSRAKYIAFLDADDWWYPNKLERQIDILESRSDLSFVCTDWFQGTSGSERRESVLRGYDVYNKPPDFDLMLVENFVNTSTVVLRRDGLLKVGLFDERLRGAEDRQMWLRLLLLGNAYVIQEVLAFRRLHSANTSSSTKFLSAQIAMTRELSSWDQIKTVPRRLKLCELRLNILLASLAYRYKEEKRFLDSSCVYQELYKRRYMRLENKSKSIAYKIAHHFSKMVLTKTGDDADSGCGGGLS